jgi:hypothetical protein
MLAKVVNTLLCGRPFARTIRYQKFLFLITFLGLVCMDFGAQLSRYPTSSADRDPQYGNRIGGPTLGSPESIITWTPILALLEGGRPRHSG